MKIRFGGVVGKQALVAVGGLAGLVVVAFKASDTRLLWGCLIGILLLALMVVVAIGIHGHQHPLEATLEGGEIVVVEQIRHDMAAKGVAAIPPSPPVLEGIGDKSLEASRENQT